MLLTILTIAVPIATVLLAVAYRVQTNPASRKTGQALTNIGMGLTLMLFALNQFLMDDISTARLIVGILFLVLGAFNLTMGIKNYGYYKSHFKRS